MLAIVDYKAGNLTSVKLALETIGITGVITSDPKIVMSADRIIFPGVGAAGASMENLQKLELVDALRDAALKKKVPFLGICVGMQVLLDFSEEDGGTETLGLIPGKVMKFRPSNLREKVPQIGWNSVMWSEKNKSDPFLKGVENGCDFYFVHSYYSVPHEARWTLASTEYSGVTFSSVLRYENIIAVQFHPEKSGKNGLKLLANFCRQAE